MRTETKSSALNCGPRLIFRLVFELALVIVLGVHLANGQQTSTSSSKPVNVRSELLFKSPAKLLYAGDNVVPTAKLNVKSYRLEEVKLPQPLEVDIRGTNKSIDSFIRLTITGEKFQPGEYTIWLGEESLTDVMRSPSELVTVIFDRALLENGAAIAVSYETLDDPSRTVLPETLYVPSEVQVGSENVGNEITVTRIRKVNLTDHAPVIEIELTSQTGFQVRNAIRVFQIGEFETYGNNPPDGDGNKWMIRMPLEVFEKLEDGSPIFVKAERGKRGMQGARIITRLKKHLLEK